MATIQTVPLNGEEAGWKYACGGGGAASTPFEEQEYTWWKGGSTSDGIGGGGGRGSRGTRSERLPDELRRAHGRGGTPQR